MSAAQDEPFRWSLNKIAEEFGWSRQTVKNKMIRAGIAPDEFGYYTTKQAIAALFGDKEQAEIRSAIARAKIDEMEAAEMEKKLVRTDVVAEVWANAVGDMRDAVSSFDLSKADRAKIMKVLREIPLDEYSEDTLHPLDADSTEDA